MLLILRDVYAVDNSIRTHSYSYSFITLHLYIKINLEPFRRETTEQETRCAFEFLTRVHSGFIIEVITRARFVTRTRVIRT